MPCEQQPQPKMSPPPSLIAQTEKPIHYSYLKEFRVETCSLFKQHQCHQHRPYTCFNWHFANQRRRRPVRRRDGTFNYSPDIYCTKYDENTGICPDGDECPFLHRVAGDVERKYHLRYYKTALCVHPTDAKGLCVKNGVHCAFAHSPDDLRAPIFDIREIQQNGDSNPNGEILEHKDRTSFVVEDQIWQDQEHVLACYKTEACKKPPRLCRQGYACPFYHNSKDRRRPPGIHKYRSTPCPNAKMADEWADPDTCDGGENCQYCHTRTEQQFHPEIFKSTRCNDMLQHGYCPRGPFCAFAHNDGELHAERAVRQPAECYAKAPNLQSQNIGETGGVKQNSAVFPGAKIDIPEAPCPPDSASSVGATRSPSFSVMETSGSGKSAVASSAPSYSSVLKQRTQSGGKCGLPGFVGATGRNSSQDSAQTAPELSSSYPKAPGFEREQQHSPTRTWTPEVGGDKHVVSRLRTTSLTLTSHHPQYDGFAGTPPTPGSLRSNSFSPFAVANGPWGSAPTRPDGPPTGHLLKDPHFDSGVGNLMDDLSLDDQLHLTTITEKEESTEGVRMLSSADSSDSSGVGLYGSSAPVSIPGSGNQGFLGSSGGDNQFRMSGSFGQSVFPVDLSGSCVGGSNPTVLITELQRTKDELANHRAKVQSWEEGLKQARHACEAWKREAEEHRKRTQIAESEKMQIAQERDAAMRQLQLIKSELGRIQQNQHYSSGPNALDSHGIGMDHTYNRLRDDLERIEGQLHTGLIGGPICGRCGRMVNGISGNPGCSVCSPNCKNGSLTTGLSP